MESNLVRDIEWPNRKDVVRGWIILGVFLFLSVVVLLISIFGVGPRGVDKYLDLGNKYLDEMDYDKALDAFETALEIDPRSVDAYLGLVEVYIRTEDFDKALEVAKEGYEATGDERLKEKIDMIESGNIYDSLGRVYRMTHYDENGNITWYHEYSYDKKGRQDSVVHKDASGNVIGSIDLEYDEDGKDIVSYGYESLEGTLIRYDKTYENGLLVSSVESCLDGSRTSYHTYYYDGELCIKERIEYTYNIDGNETTSVSYYVNTYDSEGNHIKREYQNEDGEVNSYDTFEYDADGHLVKQCFYSTDYETGKFKLTNYLIIKYDDEGNYLGDESYDGDGNLQYSTVAE